MSVRGRYLATLLAAAAVTLCGVASAIADDAPIDVRQIVDATPNSKGVWIAMDGNDARHVQSGVICRGLSMGGLRLVALQVEEGSPPGNAVSCRFKSNGKGVSGGLALDLALSIRRNTGGDAMRLRRDMVSQFVRAHPTAVEDSAHLQPHPRIAIYGVTYQPETIYLTFNDQEQRERKVSIWFGVVGGWIVTVEIIEPAGSVSPGVADFSLTMPLWGDAATKIMESAGRSGG